MIPPQLLELLVRGIELAIESAPRVAALIESHGGLSPEQKASLRARVEKARADAASYSPREV